MVDDHDDRRETDGLLRLGSNRKESVKREGKIIKALFYAVQVFYSFFIM